MGGGGGDFDFWRGCAAASANTYFQPPTSQEQAKPINVFGQLEITFYNQLQTNNFTVDSVS